ncbi:hypothetical protein EI546_03935 [Aequorivita sp. H23M31]|uniref:Uncharacterized protein n=1 Tax=Aequorivita ciconiae TaxID=2494375 RepID=A0A410G126_9FLAO|nr:hypothetical protein [Aequorivita sp. H23M31]QAA80930.1 hypothetical protein EI546_03935 [Aequorivita sp. H23M31]
MKILIIIFFGLALFGTWGCENNNKKNPDSTVYAAETPDSNMDNSADDILNDNITTNDEYLTLENSNLKEMYKYLNMSQDQIAQFETKYNSIKTDLKEKETSAQELTNLQDKILKSVLESEQYEMYKRWQKEHSLK